MKTLILICTSVALAMCLPLAATAADSVSKSRPLKCDIGPVNKTYGESQWLVYSCDDNKSVVIVSAPGNPAEPFYFTVLTHKDQYQVSGEGLDKQGVTAKALRDLEALSADDIAKLIRETKTSTK
jgi:hypothetical protein